MTLLTPEQARSFLESIADDRNPRVKVVHNKSTCMIKVPAGLINASITGKNGFSLVTMTYTVNTSNVALHCTRENEDLILESAMHLDKAYYELLNNNVVVPALPSCQDCAGRFRNPPTHGYVEFKSDNDDDSIAVGMGISSVGMGIPPKSKHEGNSASNAARFVPDDPEYVQAIINIANGADYELWGFPEWRNRLIKILVQEFGLCPFKRRPV